MGSSQQQARIANILCCVVSKCVVIRRRHLRSVIGAGCERLLGIKKGDCIVEDHLRSGGGQDTFITPRFMYNIHGNVIKVEIRKVEIN